jgi:hypothetical protein
VSRRRFVVGVVIAAGLPVLDVSDVLDIPDAPDVHDLPGVPAVPGFGVLAVRPELLR